MKSASGLSTWQLYDSSKLLRSHLCSRSPVLIITCFDKPLPILLRRSFCRAGLYDRVSTYPGTWLLATWYDTTNDLLFQWRRVARNVRQLQDNLEMTFTWLGHNYTQMLIKAINLLMAMKTGTKLLTLAQPRLITDNLATTAYDCLTTAHSCRVWNNFPHLPTTAKDCVGDDWRWS